MAVTQYPFTGDGSKRIFPIATKIISEDYVKIEIDAVPFLDTTEFDIINNSIVFKVAPANLSSIIIWIADSIESIADLGTSTNVDLVGLNIANINIVAENIGSIENASQGISVNLPDVTISNEFDILEVNATKDGYTLGVNKGRLSVADRITLLATTGTREGEVVLQNDIGLYYTWTSTQGINNGGTVINVGTGSWIAKYSGALRVEWFGETVESCPITTAYAIESGQKIYETSDAFEITVGATGDVLTINEAIEQAIKIKSKDNYGITNIRIKLLSGFIVKEQVFVRGQDLSWIEIYGEDAIVSVDPTFITASFTADFGSATDVGTSGYAVFAVDNGALPTLNQQFDLGQSGATTNTKHGILATNGGRAHILPNQVTPNGFINCGDVGAYAKSGGHITARHCVFSGCRIGIFAFESSTVDAEGAVCNDNDWYGVYVNRTSTVNHYQGTAINNKGDNVRVIRASLYNGYFATLGNTSAVAQAVPSSSPYHVGLYVLNSTATVWGASFDACVGGAIFADMTSIVSADSITSDGNIGGTAVLYASNGSTIDAEGATITNATNSIATLYAYKNGSINFELGTATTCGGGTALLWSAKSGNINADSSTLTGSTHSTAVVFCQRGSIINAQSCVATGRTGTYGIRCSEMSSVNAVSSNFQILITDDITDCSVQNGGFVAFAGALGGVATAVDGVFNGLSGAVFR